MTRNRIAVAILLFALSVTGWPSHAQQQQAQAKNSNDPIERIKDEGMNRSQVMQTLSYLTDVIGPRLTASPNLKRANEWTRDKMKEWGMEAHLEPWGPFGRGWTLKSFSAEIIAPQAIPLIAYPKAWSLGTNGPLTADIVYVEAKDEAELAKYKGQLKGKIVLSAPVRNVKARFDAPGTRLTEKDLLQLADAQDPAKARSGGPAAMAANPQMQEFIKSAILDAKKLKFFLDEGAAMFLTPSRSGDGGTIFLENASIPKEVKNGAPMEVIMDLFMGKVTPWDKDAPANLPQVTIAAEHCNRLIRMLQAGEKLQARINLDVQFHGEDLNSYNTIG
ncbi:MAG TPA: hypothetical protein PKC13_32250, partial [Blastocatellia bacterium]|nr:hypothetical protein [Blastocatellia bacterium]